MSDVSGAGNSGSQGQAPAGWYTVDDQQRYWDGAQWTDHVAPLPGQADQPQSAVAGFDSGNQAAQQQGAQQHPFGQQQDFGQQQQAQQPFGQQQAGQQQAAQQQPFGQQQDFGQQQQAQQPFGQQQAGQQQPFDQQGGQQAYGQQQAYSQGQVSPSSSDDTTMAMLAHLGGIVFGFIPSLVIWLVKKDQSQFVAHHALKALNFQILVFAAYIAWFVFRIINAFIGIPFVGGLLWLALFLGPLVFSIMGGVAANKGEDYSYPIDVKIVK